MAKQTYKFLPQEDQDDLLVAHYLANERDHHSHTTNKERYESMLTTLPEGPFRQRIEQLLAETNARLVEVEAILEHTAPQLPQEQTMLNAALARLKDKGAL